MKKKLLSLVLAGAMVASTSVSAFAESSSEQPVANISQTPFEANGGDSYNVTKTEADANISVEGNIANSTNQLPPSTINVTVPTAAKFTVDKDGKLIGSNIAITSKGDADVAVMAYKFTDTTKENYINVVDANDLKTENDKSGSDSVDRKKVALRLIGDEGSVSLKTETNNSNNGIYKLNTTVAASEESDRTLGKVRNGKTLTLKLEGDAVTAGNPLADPIEDTFTLVLKLKKVNS